MLLESFTEQSLTPKIVQELSDKIFGGMGNNDDYWVYNKEEFIDEFNIPKNVIDMVCQELNKSFDDLTSHDIAYSQYTEKYILKYMKNEFIKEINYLKQFNPNYVYRIIDIGWLSDETNQPMDKLIQNIISNKNNKIHLGKCWAASEDSVIEFAENLSMDTMIFKAKIMYNNIDVPETLVLRNKFTDFRYENEIRLLKGSSIFVESIQQFNDGELSNTYNINKKYLV